MSLVLLANEAGLHTITMSGYDSEQLKSALQISARYEDVMLIAIGKELNKVIKPLDTMWTKSFIQIKYNSWNEIFV